MANEQLTTAQALQNLKAVVNAAVKSGMFSETESVVNLHKSLALVSETINEFEAQKKDLKSKLELAQLDRNGLVTN
jgi:hypothetical protein